MRLYPGEANFSHGLTMETAKLQLERFYGDGYAEEIEMKI